MTTTPETPAGIEEAKTRAVVTVKDLDMLGNTILSSMGRDPYLTLGEQAVFRKQVLSLIATARQSLAAPPGDGEPMRSALTKARDQFHFYAEQHFAKKTPEGNEKAAANLEMAAMCGNALADAPPPPTPPAPADWPEREGDIAWLEKLRRPWGNASDNIWNAPLDRLVAHLTQPPTTREGDVEAVATIIVPQIEEAVGCMGGRDREFDIVLAKALATQAAYSIIAYLEGRQGLLNPTDDMLRAFYEAQCPPGETPAGGFSRWATWEEARQNRAPEIRKCLAAMLSASPTPPEEGRAGLPITQELIDEEVREIGGGDG